MAFERYLTEIPWWGTSLQAVELDRGDERGYSFEVELVEEPRFVIAALSLAGGRLSPWSLGRVNLRPSDRPLEAFSDGENQFFDESGRLVILNGISQKRWRVDVEPVGSLPIEMNFMAFHPSLGPRGVSPIALFKRGRRSKPHGHPGRCRACKITSKALALAIATAATLPALPAALIAAVAAYLGVAAVVAAAFIGSVLGDTVDIIAEKLCLYVGLCP
jgi:hypothetical protein